MQVAPGVSNTELRTVVFSRPLQTRVEGLYSRIPFLGAITRIRLVWGTSLRDP